MARQSEHLDEAEQGLRELQAYDDWDEPTARTDVHVHLDSKPDIEPVMTPKRMRGELIAIGTGIGMALLGGLATLLQQCNGH